MAQRVVQTIEELTEDYVARIAERTPRSQELHREAREVLCGGVNAVRASPSPRASRSSSPGQSPASCRARSAANQG